MTKRAVSIASAVAVLLAGCGPTSEPAVVPSATLALPTETAQAADTPTPMLPPIPTAAPPTVVPSPTPTALPPNMAPTPTPTALPPTAVPTMVPVAVKRRTRPLDGMVMVYVPAGEFLMGSTGNANANEKPQHTVYLDAFWIDQTEVTVAQFRAFAQASGYQTTAEKQGWAYAWVENAKEWQKVNGADWQHPFGPGSNAEDNQAVVQVSWFDAVAYCEWVGGSLPTEAQWEKAARGTDGRVYPWGNLFDGTWLNYCDSRCESGDHAFDDGYRYTAPVGSYPAGVSPYGALDMAGNVWEWTADRYDEGYYADSPAQNPGGPESGQYCVLRGGSWNHDQSGMRTAYRLEGSPIDRVDNFGYRCTLQAGD